jgi:hypothetical protein
MLGARVIDTKLKPSRSNKKLSKGNSMKKQIELSVAERNQLIEESIGMVELSQAQLGGIAGGSDYCLAYCRTYCLAYCRTATKVK